MPKVAILILPIGKIVATLDIYHEPEVGDIMVFAASDPIVSSMPPGRYFVKRIKEFPECPTVFLERLPVDIDDPDSLPLN